MGSAGDWARKRGAPSSSAGSSASTATSASAPPPGAGSSGSYEDGKFHLPSDHKPFVLLPGWDKPPPPPPAPPSPSGSGSGSGSGSASSGSEEDEGDEGDGPPGAGGLSQQPAPAPPLPGFSCGNCVFMKAQGNGRFGCENTGYQEWSGTDILVETKTGRPVVNPERSCSDWFEPATGAGTEPVPTRHGGGR